MLRGVESWRSSTAEHRFCKPTVGGSIPLASSNYCTRPPGNLKTDSFFSWACSPLHPAARELALAPAHPGVCLDRLLRP